MRLSMRVLLALAAAALFMTGQTAPLAIADPAPDRIVAFDWSFPDGTIKRGDKASVTTTITWSEEAAATKEITYVSIFRDGRQLDWGAIFAEDGRVGSITFPVDTSKHGSNGYTVVAEDAYGGDFEVTSARTFWVHVNETQASVKWPTARAVRVNAKRPIITGTVKESGRRVAGRKVRLQHATHSGWQTLASTRSSATGTFRLAAPTNWLTVHRLRVSVSGTNYAFGDTVGSKSLTVRPKYRPLGKPRHYNVGSNRFSPCHTIRYRVNPARMRKGGLADVKRAIAMVSQATGLKFKYVGRSGQVPFRGERRRSAPRTRYVTNADLLIGWVTQRQVPRMGRSTAGLGGATASGGSDRRWMFRTTDAMVALSAAYKPKAGFGRGPTRGELLLHEIGHAVGLDHAMRRHQIMGYNVHAIDRFGAGDLVGLRNVGKSAGCFPSSAFRSTKPVVPQKPLA